jgi:hypothetical protein
MPLIVFFHHHPISTVGNFSLTHNINTIINSLAACLEEEGANATADPARATTEQREIFMILRER